MRAWPLQFGHVRLMQWLDPPPVTTSAVTTRLKRYDLRFQYDPNSYIGRFIYYRGIFEEQILRAIEEVLKPGMTFIDVGANIGLHSVVASKLVGETGAVLAFEPQAQARQQLERNIALNGLHNLTLSECALGRAPATAKLYRINEQNDGQSTLVPENQASPFESVNVVTLDSALSGVDVSRGCVMKIDVEGGELDVLAGATGLLARARPKAIFVECIDSYLKRFGGSSAELVKCLQDAGYVTKGLFKGRWVPVHPESMTDCDIQAIRI